jgi:hypothetical protein
MSTASTSIPVRVQWYVVHGKDRPRSKSESTWAIHLMVGAKTTPWTRLQVPRGTKYPPAAPIQRLGYSPRGHGAPAWLNPRAAMNRALLDLQLHLATLLEAEVTLVDASDWGPLQVLDLSPMGLMTEPPPPKCTASPPWDT